MWVLRGLGLLAISARCGPGSKGRVDSISGSGIPEGKGVDVVAQRCRRVPMTETGLGVEEVPSANEERGHAVAEPMEHQARHPGVRAQVCETVSEGAGRQPTAVGQIGAEQPRPELRWGRQAALPPRRSTATARRFQNRA